MQQHGVRAGLDLLTMFVVLEPVWLMVPQPEEERGTVLLIYLIHHVTRFVIGDTVR